MGRCSMWAARAGPCRPPFAEPSTTGMAGAVFRAAGTASAMHITSNTGLMAERRGSTISCCFAGAITERCTRRASGSNSWKMREGADEDAEDKDAANQEETSCGSTGPTGGRFPKSRRHRDDRSTRSPPWRTTTVLSGFASIPKPRHRIGLGRGSTWVGRSTRCGALGARHKRAHHRGAQHPATRPTLQIAPGSSRSRERERRLG